MQTDAPWRQAWSATGRTEPAGPSSKEAHGHRGQNLAVHPIMERLPLLVPFSLGDPLLPPPMDSCLTSVA